MHKRMQIKYTSAAVEDMDEAFSYITQDNISAAEMLFEQLNQNIVQLAEFPQMGSVLSDEEYTLVKLRYRFIVVHPYMVFYRVIENTVIIHRILHGRRDYLRELFRFKD